MGIDLRSLPSADDAARGWTAHLGRGMSVDLPDEQLAEAIAAARGQMLLAAQEARVRGVVIAALEEWGFDGECADAWRRADGRARREARHRPSRPPTTAELETLVEQSRTPSAASAVAAELLLCARAMLVWEAPDGGLVLLPELPDAWRGRSIDVHDAPTAAGVMSYAVRWHGTRPALLWSAPPGVHVRAPGLDADWSSDAAEGEALLAGTAA